MALRAADDPGPAPASLIHDETRLLDEKSTEQLSRSLQDARTQLGVSLYVAAYPYLGGGTVRDRALVLSDRWPGGEPGLAIVFNRGDSQAGIAASAGLWRRYPPDEAVLTLAEATDLLSKPDVAPEVRVQRAVKLVLQRLTKLEADRRARELSMTYSEAKLAEWFAAAVMALGAIVWFSLILWRRHEVRHAALFFPEVNVATRLGAPFGGGVIGVAGEDE